jgi:serine phosphatase RsbU (regulator of sigma subunit)
MLCFSDALTEARTSEGQLLGTKGILNLLRNLDASRPQQIIPRLLDTVGGLSPENLGQDDVSVVLLRANGERTRMADNVLAPLRLLGAANDLSQLSF